MSARGRAALSLLLAVSACGYHAVYGGEAGERLHVALARAPVADAVAGDEVVSGVREELARAGALAAGDGYPRVELEVTRIDEASEGVAASGSGPVRLPAARATAVGIVARAWFVRNAGAQHERDTGDVRVLLDAAATQATDGTPTSSPATVDAFRHEDAVRAAARRAGMRLARRILGEPAPAEDVHEEWQGGFR